jgi:glycosyltransferase involved in cell wall biosynthesis
MTPLCWLAAITLAVYALAALDVMVGNRSVRSLRDVAPKFSPEAAPEVRASAPRVSVVTAARNEARNIREALRSLLELDYPDCELIVVDDRSEDRTGAILEQMAALDPRLKVLRVTELPTGWLGKNHALWQGSLQATGEILLFTDADVVMERSALARAVSFLEEERLDHLALTPRMNMPGTLLSMFGLAFILFFSLFARPWKARDPRSRRHIGIGAFNLVRAAAYRAVGGHETIRLRPDDDLKLGKILKRAGFRQDVAYGSDSISVEWYSSLGEAIRGLEKNAFAGCDYRVSVALSGVVFHLAASVWPYLAIFVTGGATRLLYCAVVALLTVLLADSAGFHGARRWHAIGFPLTAAIFAWIVLRTMILNLAHGGITWRGTFYPLAELKANRV